MKKGLGILICLLVIMVCAFALADVAIDEKNFPDKIFRAYISENCDADKDGKLSDAEIAATRSIDCSREGIGALEGIAFFTALTDLDCSYNQLTALDVSKNTALTWLSCSGNSLTTLDVSKNTALKKLSCDDTQLTQLDVSKNIALSVLFCSDNQLTRLDLSRNTALTWLYCPNNQLTNLDLSKNTALTSLECPHNKLTRLDVSKNTALTGLTCSNNQLTRLDLGKNAALMWLDCGKNKLAKLDVSKCTQLAKLVKTTAPRTHSFYGYGWWIDDGLGKVDWSKPNLFLDKTVKVIPATQIKVTSITLSKTKATLKAGKTLQLSVKKILPKDATDKTVTWKSSNKKVATVDSKGKVKAVGKGTCTITCTAKDGSKVKAKCKITVK